MGLSSSRIPLAARRTARRATRRLAAVLFAATASLLSSCSGSEPRVILGLDDGFVASRPTLADRLEAAQPLGEGPMGLFAGPLFVPVSLRESPGKALEAALAEQKRTKKPVILVASPLIAKAIVDGGSWSGSPRIIVPEWHRAEGPELPGLTIVVTDPLPAYEGAGSASGAFIAALAKQGGAPACGILFSESSARPRAALDAFAAAYSASSGGGTLLVRELAEGAENGAVETAVDELLGSDLRLLFIALGPSSGAAIRKAARPGLAIGLDSSAPETLPALAFRVRPDEAALVKTVSEKRKAVEKEERGDRICLVPAELVAERQAGIIRAGKTPFSAFLSDAALGAKGRALRP